MKTEAKQKLDALTFWEKHKLKATMDAFKVSRSTLYDWKKNYKSGGLSALHDQSKAPKHQRTRNWPDKIIKQIRHLRSNSYPNLGSVKLYHLLKPWCDEQQLTCPKPRTIARLIADAPDKMRMVPAKLAGKRHPQTRKHLERLGKDFKAQYPGHCIAMDTIVCFVNRTRYYLFTA